MKKKWQFIKEEKVYSDNILSIRHLEYYYKTADKSMVFTVQDMSSWAVIVPVTKNGEFILVKQFRAGTNSDTLEFPGGSIIKMKILLMLQQENCRKKQVQFQAVLYHLV